MCNKAGSIILKKVLISMLIIILLFPTVSCNKEKITYAVMLHFFCYGSDSVSFGETLSKDNPSYECTLSMSDYLVCRAELEIHKCYNGKLGGVYYKANISQMRNIYGEDCASYKIYEGDDLKQTPYFRTEDFQLNKRSVDIGEFMIEKEIGTHKMQFDIPAMPWLKTDEITFEITLNIEPDTRAGYPNIFIMNPDGYTKREPDETINGVDFYIFEKNKPSFVAKDSVTGEWLGDESGTLPCGGGLFVSYRKLDESYFSNILVDAVYLETGLYLCDAAFLNSKKYKSCSYKCYILFKR